ncbi:hypothetical protein [Parabacteroides distasonis]|uniref:hypothetical protein n=1 Tax=Parabacteroides distasonis TaxID=823 RepID=UPI001F256707|nr:hypothetical protein [Parabacteroides distasonis]MCE9059290.1 hypothetical protein [Parabacteroides distasonis]
MPLCKRPMMSFSPILPVLSSFPYHVSTSQWSSGVYSEVVLVEPANLMLSFVPFCTEPHHVQSELSSGSL